MNNKPRRVGYLRISTNNNTNEQPEAIEQASDNDIRKSIEPFVKPAARRQLLDLLNNGNELIVYSLDSLTRDEYVLENFRQRLQAIGVTLIITCDTQEARGNDHE